MNACLIKKSLIVSLITIALFCSSACGTTAPEATPAPSPTPVPFSEDPAAITAASDSVVMLYTYNKAGHPIAEGSAFAAFEDGVFVTNYHVVKGATTIEASTESKLHFYLDEIIALDEARDIAILRTTARTGIVPLQAGNGLSMLKGEKVIAIGSPLGLINTVSEGMFSNLREDSGLRYLQVTAPISSGSSGGALFNNAGEVIGITSASYVEGQNLNLAVPMEDVVDVWSHQDAFPKEIIPPHTTVAEALNNYSALDGTTVTIGGYVSSIVNYKDGTSSIFLVQDSSEILGTWGDEEWYRWNSIRVSLSGNLSDRLIVGDFAVFSGTFSFYDSTAPSTALFDHLFSEPQYCKCSIKDAIIQ